MTSGEEQPLHFACPQCLAWLKTSASLAGTRRRCPRCQFVFDVPRQTLKPSHGEVYPLHDDASSPSSGKAAAAELIRLNCHRCGTMLYAAENQTGRTIVCPDCGTSATVPAAPPRRHEIDVMADAGEGYALAEWNPPTLSDTPPQPNAAATEQCEAPSKTSHLSLRRGRRPTLPDHPFLTGTFTFPFSRGVLPRYLVLVAWAQVVTWYFVGGFRLSNIESEVMWIGSMWLMGPGMVLAAGCFGFASAIGLAIVRDTSNGCDTIANWPGVGYIEWIAEPLYLFCGVCMSLLPGTVLVWLLRNAGYPGQALLPASFFLLFPFVLVSMLETCSPLGFFSWPVFQTFRWAWKGWLAFYLATAWLFAVAALLGAVVFYTGGLVRATAMLAIEAAVWLIYFRLIGRLGWYCTECMRKKAEDDADEDDADEDDSTA